MSTGRAVLAILLLAFAAVATRGTPVDTRAAESALERLPYTIGTWQGADVPPADAETDAALGADAVLHRTYLSRSAVEGASGPGEEALGLYIAYYREQRPGVSVHSPLHCLPGTGWEIEDAAAIAVPDGGRMKRLVVRKNMERALVLYGYSVQGRLIANEVLSKLWLLNDRIRRGRGDAALVRIVVPVSGTVEGAQKRGLSFTAEVLPHVFRLWS